MIRYFIEHIKVEGFRGINNEGDPLELKFNVATANSVFAINGTGKSSLFDALCYAICGDIPKLSNLQVSEKPDDYYANKFHTLGEATILLGFKSDEPTPSVVTVQVHRAKDGNRTVTSPSGHPDPDAFLASLNESFTLLDHDTFAKFIDHTPLDRGRSFSSLLGLAVYSDFRQTLQTAIDTRALSGDLDLPAIQAKVIDYEDAAALALSKLELSYSQLTGNSIKDITKLPEYTEKCVEALEGIEIIKAEITGKTIGTIDFDEVKKKIKSAEGGKDREELATVIATLGKLNAVGKPEKEVIDTAKTAVTDAIDNIVELYKTTKGNYCKALYSAADKLLKSGEWKDDHRCPLCGGQTADAIGDTVATQQQQYKEVDTKISDLQTMWLSNKLRARLVALEEAVAAGIPDTDKKFQPFNTSLSEGKVPADGFKDVRNYYDKLEARLAAAIQKYEDRKKELEAKLPPSLVQLTEQVEYAKQYRDALKDYESATKKYREFNKKLTDRKSWQSFITNAANTYAEAEADLSKHKITAIETDYKDMFAKIMGVQDITPDLKRDNQRENLHVQLSDFHGLHDVSARALLSESYRNALAISVYLTAAINHSGVPRFIVLDDITSSFDSGHQLNLMEYIRTNLRYPVNSKGLQFIVLSHDGIMRKYFDGLQKTDGWHHQTIEGSPPGLVTARSVDANRIRTLATGFLSAGQVDIAQPFVRQYLEFTLMQIIRQVKIPVPLDFSIKEHNRMVANCLNAIKGAVDLHVNAASVILSAPQLNDLKNTHTPTLLANWVSHYETGTGTSISAPVMITVLDTVDKLADCFKYVAADGTTKWYRDLANR